MVDAALSARSALSDTLELRGEVTLTTVGEVLRWFLAPHISHFFQAYPHVRLRVLSDNRLSSLAAGEADVAIRFSRPQKGELVARKIRTEAFAFCVSASAMRTPQMPWLGLTGSLAMIPEQRYAERVFASRAPRLLLEDVESLGLAVQAGLGVAILPLHLARGLEGVVQVQAAEVGAMDLGPIPPRDFWMVVHRAKQRLPKVRVVMEWLEQALRGS
jgi:DNA-binding transcriptional LysR family regulator